MARGNDTETWETTTDSVVSVNTYDARGNVRAKVAGGRAGQRLQVTTAEREELNEDMAADANVCIFRNGYLRPIKNVPADVQERFDTETKRQGGQTVEELNAALDTMSGPEFIGWVNGLNEATLRRLSTLAVAADATASQIAAIDAALERFTISGPEGSAARLTDADKIVHAEPKLPSSANS